MDKIITVEKDGKKRRLYKAVCSVCGKDRGYKRANRLIKKCKTCAILENQKKRTGKRRKKTDEERLTFCKKKHEKLDNEAVDCKIIIKKNDEKSIKYRKYCKECGADRGYKRPNDDKLCKRCAQIKVKRIHLEEKRKQFPNVDFDDHIDVPYNKIKSTGSGFKCNYRCRCIYCNSDKGYATYSQFLTRCLKCVMTKQRRKDISCQVQRISKDEFEGFITPKNIAIRRSEKGRKWEKEVLQKTNRTCDICNKHSNLCAHHLNAFASFKDQRFDIDNGICLCKKCHKAFHMKYGYRGDNTKEQYEEFKRDSVKNPS